MTLTATIIVPTGVYDWGGNLIATLQQNFSVSIPVKLSTCNQDILTKILGTDVNEYSLKHPQESL